MSEINLNFNDTLENLTNINDKVYNNKSKESNKSLLIVEKLKEEKNNNIYDKYNRGLKKEEKFKLINPNKSEIIDYDKELAFNLANNIVKRRFKYFWTKRRDDSEESLEYKKQKIIVEKPKDILKFEEEKKAKERKEKEKMEKEKKEKERKEKERKEKEMKEKEKKEKERKEKSKKKETMKTIEINIEERKRENHNYKIITKLTTEVEITDKNSYDIKTYKKEIQNNNNSLKNYKEYKTYTEHPHKNKVSKLLNLKNNKLELKTKRIAKSKENKNKNTNIINNINMVKIEINENKNTIVKEIKEVNNIPNIIQVVRNEMDLGKNYKIENNKLKVGEIKNNNEATKIEGNVRSKYKNMKKNF